MWIGIARKAIRQHTEIMGIFMSFQTGLDRASWSVNCKCTVSRVGRTGEQEMCRSKFGLCDLFELAFFRYPPKKASTKI